jgi:hypothetical protein
MAIKFQGGKIRLWRGISKKLQFPNIGIRFHKDINKNEVEKVYDDIKCLLVSRYGEGIE